jgi:acyl transferase domain-containing protein/acyl carrier protein
MALAGGVSIRAPQPLVYQYQEGNILSPDGRCRAFDHKARGTIFGNGVGVVVLKRLEEAVRDGDHIYAVIRGTAINNDGSHKVAYTAPSVDGQATVIRRALATADVDPATISFIETHGTATQLGDAIEIAALKQVFGQNGARGPCLLGAVKTSLGHLDTAAGVTGLIKTALALKHKMIPPNLHFERPNPELRLEESPFQIATKLTPWETKGGPLRAGVSSFGIGGTNAHAVLEEAPKMEGSVAQRPWQLITLSSRSEQSLVQAAADLEAYIRRHPDPSAADVAYTYQVGRKHFSHRRALVCEDSSDCLEILRGRKPGPVAAGEASPEKRSVIFMFPGQGAQHVQMGRDLYRHEPTFRAHLDKCAEILLPHLGRDLREMLYPGRQEGHRASEEIDQTVYAQPALFVLEYSLAMLWMEWGVRPTAMIGHSIGEYTAACLAGVFSLEDALAVVAERGRLMQQQPRGSMLAAPLSEQALAPYLTTEISIAAINGPSLCVASGAEEDINRLREKLNAVKVASRILHTSHAYHSHLMEGAVEPFKKYLEGVEMRAPDIPFISSLTGKWIENAQATDPAYWATHLRHPVRFSDGLREIIKTPNFVLLEVGPGQTLTKLSRQHPGLNHKTVASLPEATDKQLGGAHAVGALGRLWAEGVEVDWRGFHAHESRLRVPLPHYPFERQRFWFDKQDAAKAVAKKRAATQNRADLSEWFYAPVWKQSVGVSNLERLSEEGRGWLIFLDSCGLGASAARLLRGQGLSVITVAAGEGFRRLDDQHYAISPQSAQDYDRLFRELQEDGGVPGMIAHFWSVTPDSGRPVGLDPVEEALRMGFDSLLLVAQSLGNWSASSSHNLFIVSNNLHSVTGGEAVAPAKATLLGPCRVVPQEYPNVACRSIDVLLDETEAGTERLAVGLVEEMSHVSPDEVVAYRAGRRWVESYEPVKISTSGQTSPAFKDGGIYMLTGGLGGLALALARLIAPKGVKIALVGRSGLPARGEWDAWLDSHDENDPTSERIRKVREIEEAGAEVLVISADVTSREQAESAVRTTLGRFGAIDGVLHLAGVPGGGLVQMKSMGASAPVLAPKVQGTLALCEALKLARPEFLVLFSSITSITGGLGQVDYCAANAFMGSFARPGPAGKPLPVMTVDWDAWEYDSWQEVSMRILPDLHKMLKDRRAKYGIKFEEGFEALQRIIASRIPQVIVSTQDLNAAVANHRAYSHTLLSQLLGGGRAAKAEAGARRVAHDDVRRVVARVWEEVLGVEGIGPHDNFIDLGGHSLLAVQMIARLREEFQMDLPLRTIFEHPTVAEIAQFISGRGQGPEELDGELARLLEEIEDLSEDEVSRRLTGVSAGALEAQP